MKAFMNTAHMMGDRQHPCLRPSLGVTPLPTNDGMAYLKMEFYYEISDFCMANRPWTAAI
jgi:hypothetical protein